jgi:putative (di)nucleoside polyphosphate hydrolase
LIEDESVIDLNATEKPEFDEWRWVSYYYPIKEVVDFKQTVYRQALTQLARVRSKLRKD